MKKFLTLAFFASLTRFGFAGTEGLADLDHITKAAMQEFYVPGASIGVIANGDVIYSKSFGYRDLSKKLPVTSETLFAVGSSTKPFTAFALGLLVDTGKINWDDLVITHLPEFELLDKDRTQKITIRDLLAHRTGLARNDYLWYCARMNFDQIFKRLKHLNLAYGFRDKFQYNNLMYAVAGHLIEKITGQSWEEFVRQEILNPLNMSNTYFNSKQPSGGLDFSHPYEERYGKIKKVPFLDTSGIAPAGSIYSNLKDMLKWVKLHLDPEQTLIQKSQLNEMYREQIKVDKTPTRDSKLFGYGLGWQLESYRGYQLVHHGGQVDGFSAITLLVPDKKIGLVILTNNMYCFPHFHHCISRSIFDRLFQLEKTDWIQEFKNAQTAQETKFENSTFEPTLNHYVGEYENPSHGHISVSIQNKQLIISNPKGFLTPLIHKEEETFMGSKDAPMREFGAMSFTFKRDATQNVAELHIAFEANPVIFNANVGLKSQIFREYTGIFHQIFPWK